MKCLFEVYSGMYENYDGAFAALAMLRGVMMEKVRAEKAKDFLYLKSMEKQARFWRRQFFLRRASARTHRVQFGVDKSEKLGYGWMID
jgi:hypothetical protein